MNLDLCTLAVSPLTICQFVTPDKPQRLAWAENSPCQQGL